MKPSNDQKIRNVPVTVWRDFRAYAGKHGLTLAKALEQLLTKEGLIPYDETCVMKWIERDI